MNAPLAELLRPRSFDEVVGQADLVQVLTKIIEGEKPLSLLLWGPPGTGKTTLAKLYAKGFKKECISLSAIFSGVSDIKKVIQSIDSSPLLRQSPIIFMDEIHRFNKAQQDAFLPYVEKGVFTLVGATTENPSFSLNNALLSRLRVYTLSPLSPDSLREILERMTEKIGPLPLTEEAKEWLIELASGDGRYLLNLLEMICSHKPSSILDPKQLSRILQRKPPLYDRTGETHFDLVSALHKSVRGSDPDAALYWLARMLCAGEDPHYIARRLTRMASEDIGLADPHALQITLHAWSAFEKLGSPEGELALAQAVIYLALSPKSNSSYCAFMQAQEAAKKTSQLSPPLSIRNAPNRFMKQWGYGKGYLYDHNLKEGFSGSHYFPKEMERESFYSPAQRGFERDLCKRIRYFEKLRANIEFSR